jgi:hypothetical protein
MTNKYLPTFMSLFGITVFVLGISSSPISAAEGTAFDQSIIETSVLVNLKNIRQAAKRNADPASRRRLSTEFAPIDANSSQSIKDEVHASGSPIPVDPKFTEDLTKVFDSMPPSKLVDGVDYTIDYLAANKDSLGLSDDSLILAIKSVYSAFIQSSITSNQDLSQTIKDIPSRSLQNIIPDRILVWDQSAPKWSKALSQALVEAILESKFTGDKNSIIGVASHATISGVLKVMNDSTVQANGFYPGIEAIVDPTSSTLDVTMKFDGTLEKFKNFDPAKTRVLEFAAKGLADGVFLSSTLDSTNIPTFSKELGENSISAALEFLSSLEGDHSRFGYEISKSIASGLSLGAVYASASQSTYVTDNLPATTAEEIAKAVSAEAIKTSLILGNGYDLNRLAETTAFGASMGAQLASVADESWDYRNEWASFARHLLAESSSKGSAQGALDGSIGYVSTQEDVDAGRSTTVGDFVLFFENDPNIADTAFKTNRKEVLAIANGTAAGSLLGNTSFAVYYPTLLQPVINYSAQGTNKGGLLAKNLFRVQKPSGVTEQFEIEIARALAHGAAMGAVFQVVALMEDSMPDQRAYDLDTVSAVEAVTYGSTFGAITGGIEAGEDAIIIQQAIKQGSNEGATAGAALGLGVAEEFANTLALKSLAAMKGAVRSANDQAAADANSNMAVKIVQASSRDMLQLMKLYNISPRYTNPSGIFSNPNRKEQDKNIFKEAFPVASPI